MTPPRELLTPVGRGTGRDEGLARESPTHQKSLRASHTVHALSSRGQWLTRQVLLFNLKAHLESYEDF